MTIQEKDFGNIQKDRISEMKNGLDLSRAIEEERDILSLAIVAANNHYAGFGPATVSVSLICFEKKKSFDPQSTYIGA